MTTTRQKVVRGLAGVAVTILVLMVLYTLLVLNWSYSNGERAGFLQKLSRKGVVCKTWEGELQLVAMPGSMPEKFYFSVRDEALVPQLYAAMGKRVALTYEQHPGVPSSCFGESEYFVTALHEVAP